MCFENFKGQPKLPPNNSAMAHTHNGQAVVRYIKTLPSKFTNVEQPKSMYLEELVRNVEQKIKLSDRQPGAAGFQALLTATLKVRLCEGDR